MSPFAEWQQSSFGAQGRADYYPVRTAAEYSGACCFREKNTVEYCGVGLTKRSAYKAIFYKHVAGWMREKVNGMVKLR